MPCLPKTGQSCSCVKEPEMPNPRSQYKTSQMALVKEISAARAVIVVGLGAIGSRVAAELGPMDLQRILLVDHDVIEPRNVRCCAAFKPADVGRYKAEVMADFLGKRHPGTEPIALSKSITRAGLASLRDACPAVLVGGVDNRRARLELVEISKLLGLPLIDLAVAASPKEWVARAQMTWHALDRRMDPLRSWTRTDWDIIAQRESCARSIPTSVDESRPLLSTVSAAQAAALGLAEVRRLLNGDVVNIGCEVRIDLKNVFVRRLKLPVTGYSPLDSVSQITEISERFDVRTLGDLERGVRLHFGVDAQIVLNRPISASFFCRHCGRSAYSAGPAEDCRPCPVCKRGLVAAEPVSYLPQETASRLSKALVGCLGVDRDLLRVTGATGIEDDVWIEYQQKDLS